MGGSEVSKSQVLCKVCGASIRKDTLERHWNNKHKDRLVKGEKPEFKLPTMGSGDLFNFGMKKKTDAENEDLAGEGTSRDDTHFEMDNLDNEYDSDNDTSNMAKSRTESLKRKVDNDSDDNRSHKRAKETF